MSNTSYRNPELVPFGQDAAPVTIRDAAGDDLRALERLAQLDSARLPGGRVLVAEVEDEIRAAYAVEEERGIADPFRRTAELVSLLAVRAAQLDGKRPRRSLRRRSIAPQPPGLGIGILPPRLGRRTA